MEVCGSVRSSMREEIWLWRYVVVLGLVGVKRSSYGFVYVVRLIHCEGPDLSCGLFGPVVQMC